MAGDRYKHVRMGHELDEKYKVPMTFNQSIGFKVEDERNKDLSLVKEMCKKHGFTARMLKGYLAEGRNRRKK